MSGSVVVYAGPTIDADGVHAVLPDAEVRPPAARGDLLDRPWRPGDVAVLVDGHFRERRSVGHKEILDGVRPRHVNTPNGSASKWRAISYMVAATWAHGIGQRSHVQSIAISSIDSGSRCKPAAAKTRSIPGGIRPASRSAT